MKFAYELVHKRLVEMDLTTGENIYDTKRLGFFSTKEKCENAINYYLNKPGFKEYPNDFIIEVVEADVDDYNNIPGCFGTIVYYLSHEWYDGEYDYISNLGYYSSIEKAEEAKTRYSCDKDYSEYPEGFCIDHYEIDKRKWTEGFVSWDN